MAMSTKKVVRRKSETARRETVIKVLTTAEERDQLQAEADKDHMSLSTWMRAVGLAQIRPPKGET